MLLIRAQLGCSGLARFLKVSPSGIQSNPIQILLLSPRRTGLCCAFCETSVKFCASCCSARTYPSSSRRCAARSSRSSNFNHHVRSSTACHVDSARERGPHSSDSARSIVWHSWFYIVNLLGLSHGMMHLDIVALAEGKSVFYDCFLDALTQLTSRSLNSWRTTKDRAPKRFLSPCFCSG